MWKYYFSTGVTSFKATYSIKQRYKRDHGIDEVPACPANMALVRSEPNHRKWHISTSERFHLCSTSTTSSINQWYVILVILTKFQYIFRRVLCSNYKVCLIFFMFCKRWHQLVCCNMVHVRINRDTQNRRELGWVWHQPQTFG